MFIINSLQGSIAKRVLLIVAVVGTITLTLMSAISIHYMERALVSENEIAQKKLAESTTQGLYAIMLAGNAEVAQSYADNLKKVAGIEKFQIIRNNGLEAFRDNKTIDEVNTRLGEEEFLPKDNESESIIFDPEQPALVKTLQSNTMQIFNDKDESGNNQTTYLAPILNRKDCHRCHGSDHEIRGVVRVTSSLVAVESKITAARIRAFSLLVVSIIGFVLILHVVMRRSINQPITKIKSGIQNIAEGNLFFRITDHRKVVDEIGMIGRFVNKMAENLSQHVRLVIRESHNLFANMRGIVEIKEKLLVGAEDSQEISRNIVALNKSLDRDVVGIRNAIGEASIDVNIVAASIEQLSNNTLQIADATDQAVGNIQDMETLSVNLSAGAVQINESLGQVDELAKGVTKSAGELFHTMKVVNECCNDALEAAQTTSNHAQHANTVMTSLSQSANDINEVIQIIRMIAARSQMVAINAAIEAARAGESGKGFIAVAREVRELAMQTETGVKQVSNMVNSVRSNAKNTSTAISDMIESAKSIMDANRKISSAVEVQGFAIENIDQAANAVFNETNLLLKEAAMVDAAAKTNAESAGFVTEKNREIADLTKKSADNASHVANKAASVQQVMIDILAYARKTETISGVVKNNMYEAFLLTENVRNLSHSLDDVVDSMRVATATMEEAHRGLNVGVPPFDLELIKGEDFKWIIRIQEMLSGRNKGFDGKTPPSAFTAWIAEQNNREILQHPMLATTQQAHDDYFTLVKEINDHIANQNLEQEQDKFSSLKEAKDHYSQQLDELFQVLWSQP